MRLKYYLARRYFNLSAAEWGDLPWWESQLLLEGLVEDGTIDDGSGKNREPTGPANAGTVDLSGSAPLPGGFQTRRVG